MQTASKPLYLWNDTDSVVNYSATVTGASVPAYSHKDSLTGGIAPSWEDGISTTGTHLATISNTDDDSEPATFTNFTFPFYGQVFSQVFVSSNGLLLFGSGDSSYQNRALPDSAAPHDIIAPFWDDLNPGKNGDVFFKQETDRFIVEFRDVAKHDDSGILTFQVILLADGRIRFNYQILAGQTDECTVGLQGPGGIDGLTTTHDFSYLQNGMTVEISPVSDFLGISPPAGAVPARSVQPLAGLFRSFTLAPGIHSAAVEITHDSTAFPSPLEIPASLEVVDLPGTIALTAPADGHTMLQHSYVYLHAEASDLDGIVNVAFFFGETLIETDTTGPYQVYTDSLPTGSHDITARLTDRYGQTTVSAPRSLILIADSDFDGMPDVWENANGLEPNQYDAFEDADGDFYTNLEEYQLGNNPQFAEHSDSDLIPDGWEYHNGTDLEMDDAADDPDSDTLSNFAEYQNVTDPFDYDSDGDYLPDEWEIQHGLVAAYRIRINGEWIYGAEGDHGRTGDPDGDAIENQHEYVFGFHPNIANPGGSTADRDNDGTPDLIEARSGRFLWDSSAQRYIFMPNLDWEQPESSDADSDGISNIDEVTIHNTNPTKSDTDHDGLPDKWEIDHDLNPLDTMDRYTDRDGDRLGLHLEYAQGSSDEIGQTDTDGDGWDDYFEYCARTNPLVADGDGDEIGDFDEDYDSDGLTNRQEVNDHQTDPLVPDTDLDGLSDGFEITHRLTHGFNPLQQDSYVDKDGDGLLVADEIAAGTSDNLADFDGDGIEDGMEIDLSLNPLLMDSDSDGVADGVEDHDGDGLSNVAELIKATDLTRQDTDNDGIPDGSDPDPRGDGYQGE